VQEKGHFGDRSETEDNIKLHVNVIGCDRVTGSELAIELLKTGNETSGMRRVFPEHPNTSNYQLL
jgi:hypothetical protein